jgi:glycosyltransferase 2 family protein
MKTFTAKNPWSENLGKKIVISLLFASIVYFILIMWAGWDEIKQVFKTYPLKWIFIALLLSTSNFIIRFFRYNYLLNTKNINVRFGRNFLIHFSGLSLTMTPGKIGEVIKSYFLAKEGYEPEKTLPVIFIERLTDLVAVLILAGFGVFIFQKGYMAFVLSFLIILILISLIGLKPGIGFLENCIKKIPYLKKFSLQLSKILEITHESIRSKHFSIAVLFGIVAWALEAFAFYLLAKGVNINLSIMEATFIYSISTLAGVVFPGGLGGMEGMMGLLLAGTGTHGSIVSLIFLIRGVTLWWATFCGLGALTWTINIFKKVNS